MKHTDNIIDADFNFDLDDLLIMDDADENTETDPKQKPEVEPEHLPKEDPGQSEPDPDEDDDDDPLTEIEIGDDPDEIGKKTTIF